MLQPENYQLPNDGLSIEQYEPPETPPITEYADISGQTRLEELEEQYPHNYGFSESVLEAVRAGEIGLLPVGNAIHIKHTDN